MAPELTRHCHHRAAAPERPRGLRGATGEGQPPRWQEMDGTALGTVGKGQSMLTVPAGHGFVGTGMVKFRWALFWGCTAPDCLSPAPWSGVGSQQPSPLWGSPRQGRATADPSGWYRNEEGGESPHFAPKLPGRSGYSPSNTQPTSLRDIAALPRGGPTPAWQLAVPRPALRVPAPAVTVPPPR